ncbi:MAG: ATP-binding protein, partial [Acidobacteria bacterium]|nr:ATP-binding protein [Acidobacteriota bacterium]
SQLQVQLNLSSRLAAISRLTGGVAHEIKNPLNAIALHLEVLRARTEGSDAAETAGAEIAIITREIARLDRVVKTFLDFTRPVTPAMTNMSLADVVRDVGQLVRPQAELRKIDVRILGSGGRLLIWGDRDLLKQAILNVVLNAFDAMPEGGKLEMESSHTGDGCLLTIRDYGAGIPVQVRDKIFDLYFSTKGSGSGIGLAMTFQVMQLHNATIDFTSESGEGTTFRLLFPAVERTESARSLR